MRLTSRSVIIEERAAGFVLFRVEGGTREYLVLRHRHGGHWGFAKGRLEPGEDEGGTARREICEETGVERIRVIDRFVAKTRYRFQRNMRWVDKSVVYYLGEVENADVELSAEHTEAAWLPCEETRRRLTYEESRAVLDQVEAFLRRRAENSVGD